MVLANSRHCVPAGICPGQRMMQGHAQSPVEAGGFAFPERTSRAGVIPIKQPWAVVGDEDHQGFLIQTIALESLENLPTDQSNFHDDVAIQTVT